MSLFQKILRCGIWPSKAGKTWSQAIIPIISQSEVRSTQETFSREGKKIVSNGSRIFITGPQQLC
jgi:hypothetical protein